MGSRDVRATRRGRGGPSRGSVMGAVLVRPIRWLGLATAGACSLLAAAGLLWVLVRPEVLGQVPTGALLGVIALVVLPGVTVAAWWGERRWARERLDAAAFDRSPADAFGDEGDRLLRQAEAIARGDDESEFEADAPVPTLPPHQPGRTDAPRPRQPHRRRRAQTITRR